MQKTEKLRLPAQHRAPEGSQDPEIITGAKIKSGSLSWLSNPGAPIYYFFFL